MMKKIILICYLISQSFISCAMMEQAKQRIIDETVFIRKMIKDNTEQYWAVDSKGQATCSASCETCPKEHYYLAYSIYNPDNHLFGRLKDEHSKECFNFIKELAKLRNDSQSMVPEIAAQIQKDAAIIRSKKINGMEKYVAFNSDGRKMLVGIKTILKNKKETYEIFTHLNTYTKYGPLVDFYSVEKEYFEFLKQLSMSKNHVPYPPKQSRKKIL